MAATRNESAFRCLAVVIATIISADTCSAQGPSTNTPALVATPPPRYQLAVTIDTAYSN